MSLFGGKHNETQSISRRSAVYKVDFEYGHKTFSPNREDWAENLVRESDGNNENEKRKKAKNTEKKGKTNERINI